MLDVTECQQAAVPNHELSRHTISCRVKIDGRKDLDIHRTQRIESLDCDTRMLESVINIDIRELD